MRGSSHNESEKWKGRGLIWDPGWALPLESEWSADEKYHYFNALNHHDLWQTDTLPEKIRKSVEDAQTAPVLHNRKIFSLMEERNKGNEFVTPVMTEKVRYCPECLHFGYHSFLSQYVFEDRCMIHGEPLVQTDTPVRLPVRWKRIRPWCGGSSDLRKEAGIGKPHEIIEEMDELHGQLCKAAEKIRESPYEGVLCVEAPGIQTDMPGEMKKDLHDIFMGEAPIELSCRDEIAEELKAVMHRSGFRMHNTIPKDIRIQEIDYGKADTSEEREEFFSDYCYHKLLYDIMMDELREYSMEEIEDMENRIAIGWDEKESEFNVKDARLYIALIVWYFLSDYVSINTLSIPGFLGHSCYNSDFLMPSRVGARWKRAIAVFMLCEITFPGSGQEMREANRNASAWLIYRMAKRIVHEYLQEAYERYRDNPKEIGPYKPPILTTDLRFVIVTDSRRNVGLRVYKSRE